jgi:hypothetical protein
MKAYRGCRAIDRIILNFSTRWRLVVNFTHQLIYPQEITPVPTDRRLSGPQSQSACYGEEKNILMYQHINYFVSLVTVIHNNEEKCVGVFVLVQLMARGFIAFSQHENF